MPSKIKPNGVIGSLLHNIARRGGKQPVNRTYQPPLWLYKPIISKGYARVIRIGTPKQRTTYVVLTDKGWEAIGFTPPVSLEE